MSRITIEGLKEKLTRSAQPDVRRFHALMARRIKTILMVSTHYEAFSLSWDGSLTEDIYGAFSLLHLQNVPQIVTVTSAQAALEELAREKYDLILVSSNLPDMDIGEFGLKVKSAHPDLPVVMLIFSFGGLPSLPLAHAQPGIDFIFSWQGSAKVLFSIIKLVEDSLNIDRDLQIARIGVILVIEDSVKQYSFFLPHLYTTLMKQTFARVPYGIDENERQLLTRTRPKVLLARTIPQAEDYAAKYQVFLHGVFSDLQISGPGHEKQQSGSDFIRRMLRSIPGLPILLISADESVQQTARELRIDFADKKSPRLIKTVEEFCAEKLGFGDFIFRNQKGEELMRARNLHEFEQAIARIPDESLSFHVRHNQFSHWLLAQGETALAETLRPLQMEDFESPDEIREILRAAVEIVRREKHRGIIADFRTDDFQPDYSFLMTGRGGLGGKARGLAFMSNLLSRRTDNAGICGQEVRIPRTIVITTDSFDSFMALNNLDLFAFSCHDDDQLRARFLAGKLPENLAEQLATYLRHVQTPLAVRSSSHMEDSSNQPFAGLYETCMLANRAGKFEERLEQLMRAVKMVYASVYTVSTKKYFQTLKLNMEEEKMAVIVQELAGRQYGDLFYPAVSGVAQSFNYYPFARIEPEDGVASAALGFGKTVVEGGRCFRFCPRHPNILPQAATPREMLYQSQKQFYALDLAGGKPSPEFGKSVDLKLFDLERAEKDGTLHPVGGVLSAADDRLVDDLNEEGPRLVTFAPLLKHKLFPLADILAELLQTGRASMGSEVEIEFALNIDFAPGTKPEFYFLQIRPMVTGCEQIAFRLESIDLKEALCACRRVMGNGIIENITDIIYCHPGRFDFSKTEKIAAVIGRLNQALLEKQRRYILIGPGRWGTRMVQLGIPVNWQQVAGAALIVETSAGGKRIDPSQGGHFFHNLAATGIGYFSINETGLENFVRWDELEKMPALYADEFVRHVRSEKPMSVYMDARNCRGLVIPPMPFG
ncbi:MAG: PEP/pyruvate-binding domain-containing protein [Kiritimatiellae bacterium]|nr:PEP/pyruvate-binding domain-containing protein [Kiritimatiellia bacterium]